MLEISGSVEETENEDKTIEDVIEEIFVPDGSGD